MNRRDREKIGKTPTINNSSGKAAYVMVYTGMNAIYCSVLYTTHFVSFNHDEFQVLLDELLQKKSKIICQNRQQKLFHTMG